MASEAKLPRLMDILDEFLPRGQVLVFVDTHDSADKLFQQLCNSRYPAISIHGRMDQADRDSAISDFKSNAAPLLIATSVCARGLDVNALVAVVNFEVPSHYEDYVHRVGRCGRAGREGHAFTFLCPEEEKHAPDLVPDDLAVVASTFLDKKKAGLIKDFGKKKGFRHSGHKGVALDQASLDAQAEKDRKARRIKLRAEGVEVASSDSDEDVLADDDSRRAGLHQGSLPAAPPHPSGAASAVASALAAHLATQPANASIFAAAAASAAQAVAARLGQTPAEQQAAARAAGAASGGAMGAPLSAEQALSEAQQRAHAAARQIASQFSAGLTPGSLPTAPPMPAGMGGMYPPAGAGALAGRVAPRAWMQTEFEINDYPKTARWKVTSKDALLAITEWTRAAITTKGCYVAPGQKPPPGERKLYLLIEAEDASQLKEAKKEVKRLLEEASAYAAPEEQAGGRYKV
ncbi:hypothetical protein T492DRAFT_476692 [Pavlovales sp. CCMP2436]|nr:hypothetical protein T492DRAFT_476692 [Pavlovales sp. CCMP2436]